MWEDYFLIVNISNYLSGTLCRLTLSRRISRGRQNLSGNVPIMLLRDLDQPFVFEIRSRKGEYRFEFYDTSSPESWRLLQPDLVIICFDISNRSSLLNIQQLVSHCLIMSRHGFHSDLTCHAVDQGNP